MKALGNLYRLILLLLFLAAIVVRQNGFSTLEGPSVGPEVIDYEPDNLQRKIQKWGELQELGVN
jgi:hypothetical protein